MFNFIKKLFKKKSQEGNLHLPKLEKGHERFKFRLPDGKVFYIDALDPKLLKK